MSTSLARALYRGLYRSLRGLESEAKRHGFKNILSEACGII